VECFLQYKEYQEYRRSADHRNTYQVDPFLQVSLEPNNADLHSNDRGFRGDPLLTGSNTVRIFALGGSTTLMVPVPYQQTYPAALEQKLRAHYPTLKLQAQNAACDWYSTEHSAIRYFFNVRYLKPSLVIIKHGINDLIRSFVPEWWCRPGDQYHRDYSHYLGPVVRLEWMPTVYFPFQHFLLAQQLKLALGQLDSTPIPPLPLPSRALRQGRHFLLLTPSGEDFMEEYLRLKPIHVSSFPSLDAFKENLRLLVQAIRRDNVAVILETEPCMYREGLTKRELSRLYFGPLHCAHNGLYPDAESLATGMQLFNQAVRELARELNVPLVDLEAHVPKTGDYLFDDVHPTEKGIQIEVQHLFEAIVRLRLLEKPDRAENRGGK
jgi:lysophospholipase L1-like esterase